MKSKIIHLVISTINVSNSPGMGSASNKFYVTMGVGEFQDKSLHGCFVKGIHLKLSNQNNASGTCNNSLLSIHYVTLVEI
jgi:hypothetical protein